MTVAPSRANSLSLSLDGVRSASVSTVRGYPGAGDRRTRGSSRLPGFTANAPGAGTSPPEEGKGLSFAVGLIYYCLTSSDTDIPPPGLRPPAPASVTCPIKYSTRSGRLHTCIHGLNYSDSKLRPQQYCQERKRKTGVVCSPIHNSFFVILNS